MGTINPSFHSSGHPSPLHILLHNPHTHLLIPSPPYFHTSFEIPSCPIAFPSFNPSIILFTSSHSRSSSLSPSPCFFLLSFLPLTTLPSTPPSNPMKYSLHSSIFISSLTLFHLFLSLFLLSPTLLPPSLLPQPLSTSLFPPFSFLRTFLYT